MLELKGITWDHPRGYDSIVAATEEFHKVAIDCRVTWDIRSLKEFGDQPISSLVDRYDLLMIDHPFVGEAHVNKLLLPLEELLPEEFLENQSRSHIGACYESYSLEGHQYALPIDAATQVSSLNSSLIARSDLPTNWNDFQVAMRDSNFRDKVIWPLCSTDLWCSFLSLAAQIGNREGISVFNDDGINIGLCVQTLEFLMELTIGLPSHSWDLNPIQALELMNSTDHFGFSPLLFGYNNYSRPDQGNIEFLNAISIDNDLSISLLGGVGIAVSSNSKCKTEASNYLQFIMEDKILSGSYFEAGGQPSLITSWESSEINSKSRNFFTNTVDNLRNAYVRPRIPGINSFQEKAAVFLHSTIKNSSNCFIAKQLNELFRNCCLK